MREEPGRPRQLRADRRDGRAADDVHDESRLHRPGRAVLRADGAHLRRVPLECGLHAGPERAELRSGLVHVRRLPGTQRLRIQCLLARRHVRRRQLRPLRRSARARRQRLHDAEAVRDARSWWRRAHRDAPLHQAERRARRLDDADVQARQHPRRPRHDADRHCGSRPQAPDERDQDLRSRDRLRDGASARRREERDGEHDDAQQRLHPRLRQDRRRGQGRFPHRSTLAHLRERRWHRHRWLGRVLDHELVHRSQWQR